MTDTTVATDHAPHDADQIAHVMPMGTLVRVFLGLLLLTVVTVSVTRFNLGSFNLLAAIGIATVKAALVVLYFMHLRYDNRFNALIFMAGLLFLAIFLGGALIDTLQYQPDIESYRQAQPM
jgi:cytochrome c oxidase subunit IV